MIARDRDLLCRAAEVMRSFGPVVVELMQRQDGGELPAAPMREVGNAFVALAHDFIDRADELDGHAIDNRTAEGEDVHDDPPTVLLGRIGTHPPRWPTVDPDAPTLPAPPDHVMRRVLAALKAWGTTPCAHCGTEPVARPDLPRGTTDGRFCGGCIARCLDDPRRDHWCPIDTHGAAGG